MQKQNPNWKETTEITGFLFAETPGNYIPPGDLLSFISNGEKPVLVTFGSMFHNQSQTNYLYKTVCESIDKANARAVLIMPDLDETKVRIPANIFIAKQIPYSWLLGHIELVVHHFGFGTTSEVLRAGLPSIPIPHIFDQKIRASEIHKSGYAYKPLNINKINGDILSKAIVQVKNDQKMKKKCVEAGKMILNENGIERAVNLINKYIEQTTTTSQ